MKTFEHITTKSKRTRVSVPLVGCKHPSTKLHIPATLRKRVAGVAEKGCHTTAIVGLADWALDELERQGLSLVCEPGPGILEVRNKQL